jgi:predicted nucleic acid-binding protein
VIALFGECQSKIANGDIPFPAELLYTWEMRIYLDNCTYNRPFDDQTQMKIHLETVAKLYIQSAIRNGVYDLVWSFMNDLENNDNPYEDCRNSIQKWKQIAKQYCATHQSILDRGKEIEKLSIKSKDALNIACAVASNCDYFITTDKPLLHKNIDGIRIINPIEFVMEMEATNED